MSSHDSTSGSTRSAAPLHLLDIFTLADRGTAEAEDAAHRRVHAYHEAGHRWALHQLRIPPTLCATHQGPASTGSLQQRAVWLSAMGPLTQGLAVEADLCLYSDSVLTTDPDAIDSYSVWQHTDSVRDSPCCCLRGGDRAGHALLDDENWLEQQLTMLFADWHRIDARAKALMTTAPLNKDR